MTIVSPIKEEGGLPEPEVGILVQIEFLVRSVVKSGGDAHVSDVTSFGLERERRRAREAFFNALDCGDSSSPPPAVGWFPDGRGIKGDGFWLEPLEDGSFSCHHGPCSDEGERECGPSRSYYGVGSEDLWDAVYDADMPCTPVQPGCKRADWRSFEHGGPWLCQCGGYHAGEGGTGPGEFSWC